MKLLKMMKRSMNKGFWIERIGGDGLKKTAFFIVLLISAVSLCACNKQAESEIIMEADIIDENLNLKDQIAELEMERKIKEQQEAVEKEVESHLLAFFQQVITGNVEEAEKMVNSQIQVADSALILKDGSQVDLQKNRSYIMSFPETEWENADAICKTVAIINGESQSKLKVYLMKVDGAWKIKNMTS